MVQSGARTVEDVRREMLRLRALGHTDTAIAASLAARRWPRPRDSDGWTADRVRRFLAATAPQSPGVIRTEAPPAALLT